MAKINLLHIIPTLQIGGAEKQVVTLLKHIDKKKYSVTLCCLHHGGPLKKELEDEDVEIVILGMRLRYIAVSLYKLIRLMRKNSVQIVHTHLYTDHVWGRVAALIAGVPVIVTTEHGRGLWKKRRHLLFERIANRFTDMKIAVSEDIRQIRIKREHASPDRIVTIMNAINTDEFIVSDGIRNAKRKEVRIKGDEFVIGTVARLDPDKAIDILLDAVLRVSEKTERVKCLLVGDGGLRRRLENYTERIGLAGKVIFTGARTDIAALLSVMDIYVNSSHREGISVSLLESMAAGKPVVATEVGGNPEIINDNSVGILVPANNAEALAGAVNMLLHDKEKRLQMGKNARERIINEFSISSQSKKIESLYENLLRKKCVTIR
jgi:glycosyltransferase involved in cell wall biosynthesis